MKLNRMYRNLISNLIVQIIATLSGIIIPKLIINVYGSALNGMVSSIGQFLIYAGLVEAGIGNAAVIALFRALSEDADRNVSIVLSETAKRYQKSGIIYTILSFAIACIYPLFVKEEVDYFFAFSMTLILACVGVIDYLVIGKYKVLLIADNRYYIINFAKVIASCVLVCGSIWLLLNHKSLIIVKGLAIITHIGEALFIKGYVKVRYPKYSFKEEERIKFEQQSSALLVQICMLITYNTDLIVMTLMFKGNTLLEISVYSVYSLVLSFCKNMMSVFTTGINATFGELYAKKELELLEKRFKHYELVFYICLFTIYTCFFVLILPFVRCYVGNVSDVNYVRRDLAIMFGCAGILSQVKDAHGTLVVEGCGAYREVRKYAVYEAFSNLLLSLVLVGKLGILGVVIGTVISHVFMDYGIIKYGSRVILPNTFHATLSRLIRNIFLYMVLCITETRKTGSINNWAGWICAAVLIAVLNTFLFVAWNYLFERDELVEALPRSLQRVIRKKV